MKFLKTTIAVFGLALLFNACGPNVEEEVAPATVNQDVEQFEVESNTGGDETVVPKDGGD